MFTTLHMITFRERKHSSWWKSFGLNYVTTSTTTALSSFFWNKWKLPGNIHTYPTSIAPLDGFDNVNAMKRFLEQFWLGLINSNENTFDLRLKNLYFFNIMCEIHKREPWVSSFNDFKNTVFTLQLHVCSNCDLAKTHLITTASSQFIFAKLDYKQQTC